jgi:hypothetical protein
MISPANDPKARMPEMIADHHPIFTAYLDIGGTLFTAIESLPSEKN